MIDPDDHPLDVERPPGLLSRPESNLMIYVKTYDEIKPYLKVAAMEGLGTRDTKDTQWYLAKTRKKDAFVGIIGVYWMRDDRARIKTVYVRDDFRGEGIGTLLTEFAIDQAKSRGATSLEAIARNPDWYIERGWSAMRSRKNGSVVVVWP